MRRVRGDGGEGGGKRKGGVGVGMGDGGWGAVTFIKFQFLSSASLVIRYRGHIN